MDLQQALGVELPVIQAPMAGAQDATLALAVARAGGLGSLPCALLGPEALREALTTLRAQTDRPINVNFFCHLPAPPAPEVEAAWREALAPSYRALGLAPDSALAAGPERAPFRDALADVLEAFRPRVVSFHFGLPVPRLVQRVRSWGATVLASATTVDEARWLEAHGADAVIAQGLEAGGHRGHFLSDDLTRQLGTFALVPQLARAVRIPVIAAGGIADAAGVAAARTLGAQAVQIGTAYLLCPEATASPVHRAALRSDGAHHTALTNVFTGRPARGIVNRMVREHGPLSPHAPPFPRAAQAVAPLRARAESLGSGDYSPLWAGQHAAGCREIAAGVLTRELGAACAWSLAP